MVKDAVDGVEGEKSSHLSPERRSASGSRFGRARKNCLGVRDKSSKVDVVASSWFVDDIGVIDGGGSRRLIGVMGVLPYSTTLQVETEFNERSRTMFRLSGSGP